jgi:hypothetical protein
MFESDEEKIISFERFNVSAIQFSSLMRDKNTNFIAYNQNTHLNMPNNVK